MLLLTMSEVLANGHQFSENITVPAFPRGNNILCLCIVGLVSYANITVSIIPILLKIQNFALSNLTILFQPAKNTVRYLRVFFTYVVTVLSLFLIPEEVQRKMKNLLKFQFKI